MTVCYFGGYNPNNSRNRIFLKGLRIAGVEVLECRDTSIFPLNLLKLFLRHWKIRKKYNVMLIGFAGQGLTLFAKLIARKPIILDAFVSLYNTVVEDRELHSKFSLAALYNFFLDWASVRLADKVLLDTREHVKYFVSKFKVKESKFAVVPVGGDDEIFYPRHLPAHEKFIVGFHGTYIPLHGVEYIVQAARILERENDIEFRLLGNGQTLDEIKKSAKGLRNVKFYEHRVPYEKLPEFIAQNDICLGIFGNTLKAKMVIPNKIYECAAMQKPIITQDSPGIRELFDGNTLMLIRPADAEALADAILKLKADPDYRNNLARNAFEKFEKFGRAGIIGSKLKTIISELL